MTNIDQNQDHTDDFLDETLDDLADMPSTQVFPAGAHLVSVVAKRNPTKVGGYIVDMAHQATVELADPSAPSPKPGDKSTLFISTKKKDGMRNEIGQGQLKLFLKPIGEMLSSSSISECLDATANGMEMVVVVGVRRGNDKYPDDQQTIIKAELVS
jgi:hypothetical protein